MDNSSENKKNDLDQYGVWIKTPPHDAQETQDTETEKKATDVSAETDTRLDALNLPDLDMPGTPEDALLDFDLDSENDAFIDDAIEKDSMIDSDTIPNSYDYTDMQLSDELEEPEENKIDLSVMEETSIDDADLSDFEETTDTQTEDNTFESTEELPATSFETDEHASENSEFSLDESLMDSPEEESISEEEIQENIFENEAETTEVSPDEFTDSVSPDETPKGKTDEEEISLDEFSLDDLADIDKLGKNDVADSFADVLDAQEESPAENFDDVVNENKSEDTSDDGEISLDEFLNDDSNAPTEHADGEISLSDFFGNDSSGSSPNENFAPDGEISLDMFLDSPNQEKQEVEENYDEPLDIDLSFDDSVSDQAYANSETFESNDSEEDNVESIDLSESGENGFTTDSSSSVDDFESFDDMFGSIKDEGSTQDAASRKESGSSESVDLSDFGFDENSAQEPEENLKERKSRNHDIELTISDDDEDRNIEHTKAESENNEEDDISIELSHDEKPAEKSSNEIHDAGDDFDVDSLLDSIEDENGNSVSIEGSNGFMSSDYEPEVFSPEENNSDENFDDSLDTIALDETSHNNSTETENPVQDDDSDETFFKLSESEIPEDFFVTEDSSGEETVSLDGTPADGLTAGDGTDEQPVQDDAQDETFFEPSESEIPEDFFVTENGSGEETVSLDGTPADGLTAGDGTDEQPVQDDAQDETSSAAIEEDTICMKEPLTESNGFISKPIATGNSEPEATADDFPAEEPEMSENGDETISLDDFMGEDGFSDPSVAEGNRSYSPEELEEKKAKENNSETVAGNENQGNNINRDEASDKMVSEESPETSADDEFMQDDSLIGEDTMEESENTELLSKIVTEISTLRDEVNSLKQEFEVFKNGQTSGTAESIVRSEQPEEKVVEEPETNTGFFAEDDEDDVIALSGDELSNILNCAEFTSADGENIEQSDSFFEEKEETQENNDLSIDFSEDKLEEPDVDSIEMDIPEDSDEDLPEEIEVPKVDDILVESSSTDFMDTAISDTTETDGFVQASENNGLSIEEVIETVKEDEKFTEDSVPTINDSEEDYSPLDEPLAPEVDGSESASERDYANHMPETEEKTPTVSDIMNGNTSEELTEDNLNFLASDENINTEIGKAEEDEDEALEIGISEEPTEDVFDKWENKAEQTEVPVAVTEEDSFAESEPANVDFTAVGTESSEPAEETNISDTEIHKAESESKDEPSKVSSISINTNAIPEDMKQEIKSVLAYMDQLLESLPEDKIEEFAKSEQFTTYKKLFNELGLS